MSCSSTTSRRRSGTRALTRQSFSPLSFVARKLVVFSLCLTFAVITTTIHFGTDYHQQLLLRRNLRRNPPELFSPSQRLLEDRNLRFLSLGGPSTGGQGLANTLDAYPYQLARSHNHNVHNYASINGVNTFPISSANEFMKQQQIMASLCTQSIVGDINTYDVITLEYSHVEPVSLRLLTHRLKERFPRAILVFVHLWSPLDLFYRMEDDHTEAYFTEWRARQLQTAQIEWSDKETMKQAMKEHSWRIRDKVDENLKSIMVDAKGVIYHLPTPTDLGGTMYAWLDWFDEKKSSDNLEAEMTYTLSLKGHAVVARDLEELMQIELRDTLSSLLPPIGSWGTGDSCQLWYETGKGLSHQKYSRGLQYKEFSKRHALEVAASTGGSLQVHNPFHEDRMVYLTYMTTSAGASSKKVYPRTKVQIHGEMSHIVLDPSHDENWDVSHRTRTSAVGVVPARSAIQLEFTPLEEYTLNRFRIVGLSFLAKEKLTYSIPSEFAMLSSFGLVVDDEEEDGAYTSYSFPHGKALSFWWRKNGKGQDRLQRLSSSSEDGDPDSSISDYPLLSKSA